jgi:hypothetical protein
MAVGRKQKENDGEKGDGSQQHDTTTNDARLFGTD